MGISTSPVPGPSTTRPIVKSLTAASPELAEKAGTTLAATTAAKRAEHRHAMIAEAAYLRAEQRHFEAGHDVEDWLAAESALKPR
ncbi:MAG: DUF2934 domain-containing protein [Steroidobacterales bacterium]